MNWPLWRRREDRRDLPLAPGTLLVVAAGVVGLAIAADGSLAGLLNGLGGLCWLVAAVALALGVQRERRLQGALVTAGVVLILALVVRPSDLAAALVGFSLGGAVVALAVGNQPLRWALLVPAAWLPAHLAIAIGRAVVDGDPRVRTDPPPTAALVPLAMVLAALAGGLVVVRSLQATRSRRGIAGGPAG